MSQLMGWITIDIDQSSGDVTSADLRGVSVYSSPSHSSAVPFSTAELAELDDMSIDPFAL